MTEEFKIVALTGASGNMGYAGFCQLLTDNKFKIRLLLRPSKKNKTLFKKYLNSDRVEIIWGDICEYKDVQRLTKGVDYVLHLAGLVSPEADMYPELTFKVNVEGTKNIVNSIQNQENSNNIKLVYIGSIAQAGFRLPPLHFGRTGDKLKPSKFDHYAESKVEAEKIVAESGLRYWVSLRQSGILYPELVKKGINPITFHIPLKGVIEWCTIEDSGRLLHRVCQDKVPEDFWRCFYNVSSGASYRLTNYEFMTKMLKAIGVPAPEKIFETKWFALKNFHGHWYTDADVLEDYLHFRANIKCDEYFEKIKEQAPSYMKLSKLVPAALIKMFMRKIAMHKVLGTQAWIKNNNTEMIKTYYGSLEEWQQIGDWKNIDLSRPTEEYSYLEHGFDEEKAISELNIKDMQQVAKFYGGECLSNTMTKGDIFSQLKWKNEYGEIFYASPNLVLFGGYFKPNYK